VVILGLADSLDASATLCVGDRVLGRVWQADCDGIAHSRAFPWDAATRVLEQSGMNALDVDAFGIAGRFTPPLQLRRSPWLREMIGEDPFSVAQDAAAVLQVAMKRTGLGAAATDRAVEWFENEAEQRGFQPHRITLVDTHTALAAAAYRLQPEDDVLVIAVQAKGDGTAVSVHHGSCGQLQPHFRQAGSPIDVHLQRCAAALGYRARTGQHRMWAAAARGQADVELLALLGRHLVNEGPGLVRKSMRAPLRRDDPLYRSLGSVDRADGAASVLEHLIAEVSDLVQHHVAKHGATRVALAGAWFDNPRLCAAIAALPGLEYLSVGPEPGWASLSAGAAVHLSGRAPARPNGWIGVPVVEGDGDLAQSIASGPVVRHAVRGGFGTCGGGARSVLFHPNDVEGRDRVCRGLGLDEDDEPIALVLGTDLPAAIASTARNGGIAAAVGPELAWADGLARIQRVDERDDPVLHATITAVGPLLAFGIRRDPVVVAEELGISVCLR
jgi:predicted NodU family carbamoyl transferase